MAQVTLYLDEETAAKLKAAAKASGLSQNKWVTR
jgi:predicted HicB family RNase H-like nuclease